MLFDSLSLDSAAEKDVPEFPSPRDADGERAVNENAIMYEPRVPSRVPVRGRARPETA